MVTTTLTPPQQRSEERLITLTGIKWLTQKITTFLGKDIAGEMVTQLAKCASEIFLFRMPKTSVEQLQKILI